MTTLDVWPLLKILVVYINLKDSITNFNVLQDILSPQYLCLHLELALSAFFVVVVVVNLKHLKLILWAVLDRS